MKKVMMILLSILLVSVMVVIPVFAAGIGSITVAPNFAKPEQTVTATFAVSGLEAVSDIGLTYTVPEGLEVVSAEWLLEDLTLQDVNTANRQAVMAVEDPISLAGETEIFRVTYRLTGELNADGEFAADVSMTANCKLDDEVCGKVSAFGTVKFTNQSHIPGDIDGNGIVNNLDAACLMQYLANWDVDYVEAALDVDGNGVVNNLDAARLMQYLANWKVEIF